MQVDRRGLQRRIVSMKNVTRSLPGDGRMASAQRITMNEEPEPWSKR
jgi:hypothetical protein